MSALAAPARNRLRPRAHREEFAHGRRTTLDAMTVHAEARADRWDGAGLAADAERLVTAIKDTIGVTTSVIVEPPGPLERSQGKAKRVVDRRPKG